MLVSKKTRRRPKWDLRTEVQYGSSAGMLRSPQSLKMPFLKTSFESLAPILIVAATRWHVSRLSLVIGGSDMQYAVCRKVVVGVQGCVQGRQEASRLSWGCESYAVNRIGERGLVQVLGWAVTSQKSEQGARATSIIEVPEYLNLIQHCMYICTLACLYEVSTQSHI